MSKPIIAIVGRPNVGKSTLFNKLIGKRISIVKNTCGVTRDRIYFDCEWAGKKFLLIDTGGIDPFSYDVIINQVKAQAEIAIDSADVIIFLTDITSGIISTDQEIATMLKKSGKHVILCVNKCDNIGSPPPEFYEFYKLGFGDPIAISSVHGHGTGDLLDEILKNINCCENNNENNSRINVAVIGRPNAGKSSLINKITNNNRCIVSDIAGTTRDSIDTNISNSYGNFTFIDTAGIRRKSKINDDIEKYSIIRAKIAIERSDVCIIMLDALQGFAEQDSKIAGLAHESGKGCIIAVNKWDLINKDDRTMLQYKKRLQNDFSFMSYAPLVFISAKSGQKINSLFKLINEVSNSCNVRIATGTLNELLSQAVSRTQPPTDKGKRLKIFYMTQASIKPPTFVFFVNNKELFHFSYQRYIENQLRESFGFNGTPIRFIIRNRSDKK